MVLGELLFVICLSFVVPLHEADLSFYQSGGMWETLENLQFYQFILLRILLRGLRGAFFSLIAFLLSVFIQNKLFVFSVPLILYYFILYISSDLYEVYHIDIFKNLTLSGLYGTFQFGVDREWQSLGFTFLYTVSVGILCWLVFERKVRRNV
jgi:hypothetical protein